MDQTLECVTALNFCEQAYSRPQIRTSLRPSDSAHYDREDRISKYSAFPKVIAGKMHRWPLNPGRHAEKE